MATLSTLGSLGRDGEITLKNEKGDENHQNICTI